MTQRLFGARPGNGAKKACCGLVNKAPWLVIGTWAIIMAATLGGCGLSFPLGGKTVTQPSGQKRPKTTQPQQKPSRLPLGWTKLPLPAGTWVTSVAALGDGGVAVGTSDGRIGVLAPGGAFHLYHPLFGGNTPVGGMAAGRRSVWFYQAGVVGRFAIGPRRFQQIWRGGGVTAITSAFGKGYFAVGAPANGQSVPPGALVVCTPAPSCSTYPIAQGTSGPEYGANDLTVTGTGTVWMSLNIQSGMGNMIALGRWQPGSSRVAVVGAFNSPGGLGVALAAQPSAAPPLLWRLSYSPYTAPSYFRVEALDLSSGAATGRRFWLWPLPSPLPSGCALGDYETTSGFATAGDHLLVADQPCGGGQVWRLTTLNTASGHLGAVALRPSSHRVHLDVGRHGTVDVGLGSWLYRGKAAAA